MFTHAKNLFNETLKLFVLILYPDNFQHYWFISVSTPFFHREQRWTYLHLEPKLDYETTSTRPRQSL